MAVAGRQREDGETFLDVLLEPGGELRSALAVLGDHCLEKGLGERAVLSLEDVAKFLGDLRAQGDLGNVLKSVLLEMKLAALPEDAREAGSDGFAQAWMIIADEEGGAVETAFLQRVEKVAPMDVGLAQGGADAEDAALSGGINSNQPAQDVAAIIAYRP